MCAFGIPFAKFDLKV